MRRLLQLVVALAALAPGALPPAAASGPYVVALDWQEGSFAAGQPVGAGLADAALGTSVNGARFAFDVDACHRHLLVDLLYAPDAVGAGAPGVGSAEVAYELHVQVLGPLGHVGTLRVRESGYGKPVGLAPAAGAHELRLTLATGAAVDWQLRVRAREVPGEPACLPPVRVSEVEANPAGTDAGHEWLEIVNPGAEPLDLSLWTVRATHGSPKELQLPADTVLAPGARLVVEFRDGQFLDNEDEVVQLVDAFGQLRDETPPHDDAADDGRSWQRDDAGAWSFAPATPGA